MGSLRAVAVCVRLVRGAAACSSDDDAGPPPDSGGAEARSSTTATQPSRPAVDIASVELRPVPAGKGVAMAVDVLEDLDGDAATYGERFAEGLDHTISAGFLLPRDRGSILAAARTLATPWSPMRCSATSRRCCRVRSPRRPTPPTLRTSPEGLRPLL